MIYSALLICVIVLFVNRNQVEGKSRFLKKMEKRSDTNLVHEFENVS